MSENGTQERRPRHTGNGGARARPRGRRADPGDLDALRQLLSDPPYRRDLLIEYLHVIQDHDRCLRPSQLAALAELMGLSQTEVYEVATFYAHFDVVDEHEPAPPRDVIEIGRSPRTAGVDVGRQIMQLIAPVVGHDRCV